MNDNWERAKALMNDIEMWRPNHAEKLRKKFGTKGIIKQLKEYLDKADAAQEELEEYLLNQMEKAKNPLERMQQENQARMMAQEYINEEIRQLYIPTPEETNEIEDELI